VQGWSNTDSNANAESYSYSNCHTNTNANSDTGSVHGACGDVESDTGIDLYFFHGDFYLERL